MILEDILTLRQTLKDRLQHQRAMWRAWEYCESILMVCPQLGEELKNAVFDDKLQPLKDFYRRHQHEADIARWEKRK